MKYNKNENPIAEVVAQNPGSITAAIQQYLNNPHNEKVIVVVEGWDDKCFFSKFFDEKTTQIEQCFGCESVLTVFKNLNHKYKECIIAIKDADYDILEGIEYPYPNFFLTDFHDLEMMLLHSRSVENSLCAEYLQSMGYSIVEEVLREIKALSYLRWHNRKNKNSLHLTPILHELYKGSGALEYKFCLDSNCVKNANKGKAIPTEDELQAFESQNVDVDLFQLSVGHDACGALALKVKCLCSKNGVKRKIESEKTISSAIRMIYSAFDFKKTELYKNLRKWESDSHKNLLNNAEF